MDLREQKNILDSTRKRSLEWILNTNLGNGKYRFSFSTTPTPTLYSSAYAVLAMELFDNLVKLSELEYKELVSFLTSSQNRETGFFCDSTISYVSGASHDNDYTSWHMTCCILQALDALDVSPKYELKFLEPFQDIKQINKWLESLNMKKAWKESNKIMSLLTSLYFSFVQQGDNRWLFSYNHVLDWLDKHQDPKTGFWGCSYGSGLLNGMAATYHLLMFYYAINRPIRYMSQIIDSTLCLQVNEGNFSPFGGNSCIDLDAIDILVSLSRYTDYRLADVKIAAKRLFCALTSLQNEDGGFPEHSVRNFKLVHLAPLGFSYFRHKCFKTYVWQTKQIVKHTLFRQRQMYRDSVKQCCSSMYDSNLWSTWFRPLAMFIIADRFPEDYDVPLDFHPKFRRLPGLGYTSRAIPYLESRIAQG